MTPYQSAAMDNFVGAIEAFVDAKVAYHAQCAKDAEWANARDVDETREHMRDKLVDLMA